MASEIQERTVPRKDTAELRRLLNDLTPFRRVNALRSTLEAAGTLAAFVGLWIATYLLVPIAPLAAVATGLLAGLCLSRIFVLFHDCVHHSLFRSRGWNRAWGTLFGLLVYTPYERWRRSHLDHHGAVGDIDRSEVGYLRLRTVREYLAWPRWRRIAYRIFRSPPVLIGLLPVVHFSLGHRLPAAWRKVKSDYALDVHITSLVLVALNVFGAVMLGWRSVAVHVPICVVGASVAGWLFFVQHHFETAVWKTRESGWAYDEGALHGSSYLRLPRLLDWVWLGIGYHHVHHLDAKVPSYRLGSATHHLGDRLDVPGFTLWESLPYAWLALWDEEQARLVRFPSRTA